MGIDIYMRWHLMTEEDIEKQYKGFDITIGKDGYLREAYHGAPYATRELVPEAFDSCEEGGVYIPSATLRDRLPVTMKEALRREREIYKSAANEDSPAVRSFVEFVELAERLDKQGTPYKIIASW
jgi:hypothetical protein